MGGPCLFGHPEIEVDCRFSHQDIACVITEVYSNEPLARFWGRFRSKVRRMRKVVDYVLETGNIPKGSCINTYGAILREFRRRRRRLSERDRAVAMLKPRKFELILLDSQGDRLATFPAKSAAEAERIHRFRSREFPNWVVSEIRKVASFKHGEPIRWERNCYGEYKPTKHYSAVEAGGRAPAPAAGDACLFNQ